MRLSYLDYINATEQIKILLTHNYLYFNLLLKVL